MPDDNFEDPGRAQEFQNLRANISKENGLSRQWLASEGEIANIEEGSLPPRAEMGISELTRMRCVIDDLSLVNAELRHRLKNVLGVVNSLVAQARKDDPARSPAFEALSARITALSRTQTALSFNEQLSANIFDLVMAELPEIYGRERFLLDGPNINLNPKASTSFSMVIHELATNAAKYGALSNRSGKVRLSWRRTDHVNEDCVRFFWQESGAPKLAQVPASGFGMQLVSATILNSLRGEIHFDWRDEGLCLEFAVPFQRLKYTPANEINEIH